MAKKMLPRPNAAVGMHPRGSRLNAQVVFHEPQVACFAPCIGAGALLTFLHKNWLILFSFNRSSSESWHFWAATRWQGAVRHALNLLIGLNVAAKLQSCSVVIDWWPNSITMLSQEALSMGEKNIAMTVVESGVPSLRHSPLWPQHDWNYIYVSYLIMTSCKDGFWSTCNMCIYGTLSYPPCIPWPGPSPGNVIKGFAKRIGDGAGHSTWLPNTGGKW